MRVGVSIPGIFPDVRLMTAMIIAIPPESRLLLFSDPIGNEMQRTAVHVLGFFDAKPMRFIAAARQSYSFLPNPVSSFWQAPCKPVKTICACLGKREADSGNQVAVAQYAKRPR